MSKSTSPKPSHPTPHPKPQQPSRPKPAQQPPKPKPTPPSQPQKKPAIREQPERRGNPPGL